MSDNVGKSDGQKKSKFDWRFQMAIALLFFVVVGIFLIAGAFRSNRIEILYSYD